MASFATDKMCFLVYCFCSADLPENVTMSVYSVVFNHFSLQIGSRVFCFFHIIIITRIIIISHLVAFMCRVNA